MEQLTYTQSYQGESGWIVEEQVFDSRYLGKCEAMFTQGNGYLGVRNALEEQYVGEKRGMFINGTFNRPTPEEVPELPNFPDITSTVITINGYRFCLERGNVSNYRRSMNYKTGESVRTLTWSCPTGEIVDFEFSRFVSIVRTHVICGCIRITPKTGTVEVAVESGIDASVTNTGVQHFKTPESQIYEGRYMQTVVTAGESGVEGAVQVVNRVTVDGEKLSQKPVPYIRNRRNVVTYKSSVREGSTFCIEKLSCVHTSRDLEYVMIPEEDREVRKEQLKADGMVTVRQMECLGYDTLLKESVEGWEQFWNLHDVKIDSKKELDQIAVRFAIYHLHIMNQSSDSRLGVGAKGLSGEEYKGHSFWDIEIFLMPYYLLNDPKAAKNLLIYRYHILEGARRKARRQGYKGAMYPWESAWITDEEVCADIIGVDVETGKPMRVLCGEIEIHISADIAYAIMQYYYATLDTDFMEQYGYEVLLETARFWASRAEERNGRYEILHVIGPDEYKEEVDNDVYTNYMAAYNMKAAMDCLSNMSEDTYHRLDKKLNLMDLEEEVKPVLENLYLPVPQEGKIIPQNDTYLSLKEVDLGVYKNSDVVGTIHHDYSMERLKEIKASKQGDLVVLMYLLGDLFSEEVQKKNYKYYETYTTHDSSLSKSTHAIIANDLGMKEEAYRFFAGAAATDVGRNLKSCDNGIHSAANGGVWQSVVMGFGGVRVIDGELQINPKLPEEWRSLEYSIIWRGERIHVSVEGNKVNMTKEKVR